MDPDDELTGLAAEKAKLSKMNRKEKIEYMMMYYKGYALGALVVIGLIWVLVYQLFLADKRERFQVAVVNGYITESDMDFSDRLINDGILRYAVQTRLSGYGNRDVGCELPGKMGHEHHGRFDGCGHCSEELYGLFGLGPHL